MSNNPTIRNIAIIAHVDHGKTTLVDHMFRQSGAFDSRAEIQERVMDNLDLERERGITIAAKNCSVFWKDTRINILDTPGHADFGSEVERSLMMVDGAILLVDAAEGPLPQTRFVLKKALEQNFKLIVCLNKIDRGDARPKEVLDEVYDLFIDLDATEEQIEFPVYYLIAREGIAKRSLSGHENNLDLLFDAILDEIPPPECDPQKPFQMLVANLDYSDYLGQLAVGKVFNGSAHSKDALVRIAENGSQVPLKAAAIQSYFGIEVKEVEKADAGDIILLAGIDEVEIGDTICSAENPVPMKRIHVDEPTVSMTFMPNTSPLSGREGTFLQGQKIAERLRKETLYNVGLQVEASRGNDRFTVKGRGEFQLAILIETMRREGFELSVSRPSVLMKEGDNSTLEPVEKVLIDCAEEHVGIVTERILLRKGEMTNMVNHGSGRVRMEFSIPTRGLIGYRGQFLTDTRGTGVINSQLDGYDEYRGNFPSRTTGSLVADREGKAVAYALFNLQQRGRLFVSPGDVVYEGMVIGEHSRSKDLNVNPCKAKKLSNMRAAGKDENIILTPASPLSLEQAIEFIREDELIEVTPKSIRLRKRALNAADRKDRL